MTDLMVKEEERVAALIHLSTSDLALLDAVKRRMGLKSRGHAVSSLLQAVIDVQPATVELARTAKMRKQRRTKTVSAEFA